jgi:hypothetical protein
VPDIIEIVEAGRLRWLVHLFRANDVRSMVENECFQNQLAKEEMEE